jgi:hypothetical protein
MLAYWERAQSVSWSALAERVTGSLCRQTALIPLIWRLYKQAKHERLAAKFGSYPRSTKRDFMSMPLTHAQDLWLKTIASYSTVAPTDKQLDTPWTNYLTRNSLGTAYADLKQKLEAWHWVVRFQFSDLFACGTVNDQIKEISNNTDVGDEPDALHLALAKISVSPQVKALRAKRGRK